MSTHHHGIPVYLAKRKIAVNTTSLDLLPGVTTSADKLSNIFPIDRMTFVFIVAEAACINLVAARSLKPNTAFIIMH